MNLTTFNNIHFNFHIVGKETPQEDWLDVKISYQGNGLKHSYVDPTMMTSELKELIDWLTSIYLNHKIERRFTPIDQMIDFRFFGFKNGVAKIQIQLHYQYNNTRENLKLNFLINKMKILDWIAELKRSYNYYSPSIVVQGPPAPFVPPPFKDHPLIEKGGMIPIQKLEPFFLKNGRALLLKN